jgi:hypothetical protein
LSPSNNLKKVCQRWDAAASVAHHLPGAATCRRYQRLLARLRVRVCIEQRYVIAVLAFLVASDVRPKYLGIMGNTATHCRPFSLAKFDGRTRRAKFLREVWNNLADEVGGTPTPFQVALIESAARAWTFREELDAKRAAGGVLSADEASAWAMWDEALARNLRDLGVHGTDARSAETLRGTSAAPKMADPALL